jgi:stress response protein YsnF
MDDDVRTATDDEFGGPAGGVIYEVVLHEERPLVSTEIVPMERVRLSKLIETEQHIVSGPIRKEQIDVELPDQAPTSLG